MGTQYATTSDLTAQALPAAALTGVTSPEQNAALLAASVLIDSYLGGRFTLPLLSYGEDIKNACCKIAAWNLIARRGLSPGNEAFETLRAGYKDAVAWLKDVSDGRATPAFPTAKDNSGYDPNGRPFVVSAAPGGIGLNGGAMQSSSDDESVRVGAVGAPRLRGW